MLDIHKKFHIDAPRVKSSTLVIRSVIRSVLVCARPALATALFTLYNILAFAEVTPTTPLIKKSPVESKINITQKGGAVLEYPRGRFQEYSAPGFFNWTIIKPVKSISLKVFTAGKDYKFDPEKDLIARYDFLNTTKSASWTQESFTRGHYVWVIEGYNETSSKPIYVDTAQFEIEQIKHLDLRTRQFGLLVGFSRGKYTSIDSTFKIGYDTTPTTYGIVFKGGSPNRSWNLAGQISDFVLQGSVRKTMTAYLDYNFLLTKAIPYETEIFIGPSLRAFQFPRTTTLDGETLDTKTVGVLNPGINLSIQKQFDLHVTFYSKLNLDIPYKSTEDMDFSTEQTNITARAGLLYGLFWPVGFAGEIQYHLDRATTKNGSEDVEIMMSEWAVGANLLYAF